MVSAVIRPTAAKEQSGWLGLAGWLLLAVVSFFFIVPLSQEAPSAYEAVWSTAAVHGTFTSTSSECDKDCTYYGPFESTDGKVGIGQVQMDELLLSVHKGARVAVVWVPGTPSRVYLAHGSRTWLRSSP